MLELLNKISGTHGVSGYEANVAKAVLSEMKKYTNEQYIDNLGNLITVKRGSGNGKKIMLCAHMDEIGLMATYIEDKGQIRVSHIGGIGFSNISYDRVISENGVIGILVPDGKTKPAEYSADKFYIDIGVDSKEEASKKVKIGDVFCLEPGIVQLCENKICGHPLDDRIGCALLIEIAKALNAENLNNDIYYVFSVQEEVGCRGSKTAAFSISPDISLAFDVTGTGDIPNATPMACSIGNGAAIKVKDASAICDPKLVDELIEVANENGIKYQLEVLIYGGTDTSSMQTSGMGSRAAAISIPTRYIHSGNEMLDMNDVFSAKKLALAYIKKADALN